MARNRKVDYSECRGASPSPFPRPPLNIWSSEASGKAVRTPTSQLFCWSGRSRQSRSCRPSRDAMADGDHGRLRAGLTHLKHRVLVDAAEAYGAMAPVVPLRRFRPLVADRDFYQEIGLLQVNQLGLMSYASAPVQLMLEPTASVQLVAGFSGCWLARTPEGVLASRAGCGLLLPSGPIEVRGGSSSAVMAMQPADLTRAAAAMAGNTSTLAPTALAAPSICRFQAPRTQRPAVPPAPCPAPTPGRLPRQPSRPAGTAGPG